MIDFALFVGFVVLIFINFSFNKRLKDLSERVDNAELLSNCLRDQLEQEPDTES